MGQNADCDRGREYAQVHQKDGNAFRTGPGVQGSKLMSFKVHGREAPSKSTVSGAQGETGLGRHSLLGSRQRGEVLRRRLGSGCNARQGSALSLISRSPRSPIGSKRLPAYLARVRGVAGRAFPRPQSSETGAATAAYTKVRLASVEAGVAVERGGIPNFRPRKVGVDRRVCSPKVEAPVHSRL